MEPKTIAFLTTGHAPFDDRIFYHFADTLSAIYSIVIISSNTDFNEKKGNIQIDSFSEDLINSKKQKIEKFYSYLKTYTPDLIICSEPLPIVAAKKFRKKTTKPVKIAYDITEWYPTASTFEGMPFRKKIIKFTSLSLFNYYAASCCDAFIFGELYKSIPYRILFPLKKREFISYYPDLKYITYEPPQKLNNSICLGYTGKISIKRGIDKFFEAVNKVQLQQKDLKIRIKIIGWFVNEKDKNDYNQLIIHLNNINIEFIGPQKFENFSAALNDIDLFFDLRKPGIENNLSLPIKLFFYAAEGRPVIYSKLKAISGVTDTHKFGYLVNPANTESISHLIINYINNQELYIEHCTNARKLAEEKYNWNNLSPILLNLVSKLISEK
jgi:glycosyltransferase involved in cell wall biosynthesis